MNMITGGNIIYIGCRYTGHFDPEDLIRFTPSEKADDTIRYGYRNYYVDRTIDIENGVLSQIVAVTPQGFRAEALANEEITGLLAYFGFDGKKPFFVREEHHPYNPFSGPTLYYSQPVVSMPNVG